MIRVEKTPDGRGFRVGPFDGYNEAWAAAAGGMAGLGLAGDVIPGNPDLRSRAWIYADTGEVVVWYCYVTTEPPVPRAAPAPTPTPAAYDDLTPAGRRKAVAADVLARLDETNYATGEYLATDFRGARAAPRAAQQGGDLGPHAAAIAPECTVCLLGGLLLAKARLFDNVPVSEVLDEKGNGRVAGAEVARLLADVFDPEQLGLMECAFELDASRGRQFAVPAERCADAAADGGAAGPDPRARVRRVMDAIIASPGGLYDPPERDRGLTGVSSSLRARSHEYSGLRRAAVRDRLAAAAAQPQAGP